MSKPHRSHPTAGRNDVDGHLSVPMAEALGDLKVAQAQAVVDGPTSRKSESLFKELVFGSVAVVRVAARAAARRVRGVFSRSSSR